MNSSSAPSYCHEPPKFPMPHQSSTTPLVSVVVTTYNHGPYIEECLESLANQDCDFPFEILVGEDCSTDDTRERLLRLSEKYPKLIRPILSEQNLGSRKNSRNLTSLATGKYIAICEGDDYWQRPDKLRRQVEILEADASVALVCTDADAYFHNTGRRIHSVHERNGQWTKPPTDMTLALLTRKINIFTCTACMPKALRLRIWEENLHDFSEEYPMGDIQLWIQLSLHGRIVPIRESCATYRVIAESASRSRDFRKIFKFQESALKISEYYVRKFGYDASVLHQVRMSQFWGMFQIVTKHQNDELRQELCDLLESRSMKPIGVLQTFAFWTLQDRSRMDRFQSLTSYIIPVLKIPGKYRAGVNKLKRFLNR